MDHLDKLVSRLEKVTVRLESLGAAKPQLAPKPSHLAASTDVPAHVKAYDNALSDVTERWSALSKEIGGDQDKVMQVFSCLRNFLWTAAGRAEPSTEEIQKLVAPVANLLTEISAFKESQRKSPLYNHLCAVSEGIPAVGWVLVVGTLL
ncbi:hypothetical protein OESDEN_14630 [Oesophagostomum dentatum]|uniref:CAP N-terminal domain-containing protein n=1 Tax=Oesophagostomum dentatum TaxID=61180 RepID=A0A0B1SL71_OESDE|nr:hypothetical protein OESDEN_14630 [Oesophagostomum dentatum]